MSTKNLNHTHKRVPGLPLVIAMLFTLGGCGGGGGSDNTVNQGGQQEPPPAPTTQFECSEYDVGVSEHNNFVQLSLPGSAVPPVTVNKEILQEWTACVLRSGNISGLYQHVFFVNEQHTAPVNAAYHGKSFLVSNFVQGIGIPEFEDWADWGVNGTLKSVVHFPSIESFLAGPKLHEFAHAWGAFAMDGNEDSGLNGHWGFSSANGQLGGFDLQYLRYLGPSGNCPQSFAAARSPLDTVNPFFSAGGSGFDGMPYSPIELYLMGLVDGGQLPETTIVAPGAYYIGEGSLQFCAPNGLLEYPTKSWLENRHGPRNPTAFGSVVARDVLIVKVGGGSRYIDSEQSAQIALFDELLACEIQDFVKPGPNKLANDYNYWEATYGLGTMRVPQADEICLTCVRFQDTYPTPTELEQQCKTSFPTIY